VSVLCVNSSDLQESWDQWKQLLGVPEHVQLLAVDCSWLNPRRGRLGQLIASRRFDVIHLHGIWGVLVWNVLALSRSSAPVTLLAPHGMLSAWSLSQKPLKKSLALALGWRRAMQGCDAMHVLHSQEQCDVAAALGATRTVVIPNGVPASAISSSTGAAEANSSRPYVLFLARLHHMKGPERVLAAFRRALDRVADAQVRLVMAGPDGGELAGLKLQAHSLGIASQVEFPGAVYGRDKDALLNGAAVFCQPSRYEGFSLSILEALAAGVPVVTTHEANFPEIAKHGAGHICSGDPDELGDALLDLLTQPQRARTMGESGRKLVKDYFTWERIVESCLVTYQDLMVRRRLNT
jgi:glycosyltransferase involved in cell wall biosynthesis